MGLSLEERQAFLAEPHVAAISVSAGAGRAPLTVPIWYYYTAGGELWIPTGKGSRKHQLIEAAGRLTLMVDRERPTVRYVSVEGPVTKIEALAHDQHRQGPRVTSRRNCSRATSNTPKATVSRSPCTSRRSTGSRRTSAARRTGASFGLVHPVGGASGRSRFPGHRPVSPAG
ncbi:Putative pyridoxamine 5'-phosphate oxidase-related protein [Mycobacteroides abscessus]|nr:Putative pyridoxamine 5'-phosphate oxidase-related protein [Mycobacteroides abscessus]